MLAVYLALVSVLAAVFVLNRHGTINDDDAAGVVALVFGGLFGLGFYRDRQTSEALDENPKHAMVPFTQAGLRAGAPWYLAALLTLGVLMLVFRTG